MIMGIEEFQSLLLLFSLYFTLFVIANCEVTLKKYSAVKITGNGCREARKRDVKKLLLFIEWSIAWLVRIKLLDKRRQ